MTRCSGMRTSSGHQPGIPTLLPVTQASNAQPPPAPPNPQPPNGDEHAKNWTAIVVAVIGAIATIVAAVIGVAVGQQDSQAPAANQTPSASQGPLKITITNKDDISPEFTNEVKIQGAVENLRPGQTVWAFDSNLDDRKISAHDGPCPVNDGGNFSCPPITIGRTPEDNGVKFKIFVSVLDDSDIAEQIELSIARSKDNYSAMRGITNEPPGVAKDEVVTVKKQ